MEENAVQADEVQPEQPQEHTPPDGPELAQPQITEAATETPAPGPTAPSSDRAGEPEAPALLTGEEQKARDQAHAQRAVSALRQAAEALRSIESALESAVNKSVSGAKATLICFAGRLDHEVRELSRHA
jgi:hypothetical protein